MELKNFFAQDLQGNVIPNPTVYVYAPATTTLVSGLKNADGGVLSNPFTGTVNGQISFAAPDGEYDLRVTGAGRDYTVRARFIDAVAYVEGLAIRPTFKTLGAFDVVARVSANIMNGIATRAAVFGDSTYRGYDAITSSDNTSISPCSALQSIARLHYGNTALTVDNLALSGTTVSQLLRGENGYPGTLASRLPSITAPVVYIGFGLNDVAAFIANVPGYTPETFRADTIEVVRILRDAGKAVILMTPIPNFNGAALYGNFTGVTRAEMVKFYADIVRSLAATMNIPLVDNFLLFERMISGGHVKPYELAPDGLHGASTTQLYPAMGRNMFRPLVGLTRSFTGPNQYLLAHEAAVKVENQGQGAGTTVAFQAARFGLQQFSFPGAASTMRVVFDVEDPGLDIYMGHAIWANGTAAGVPVYVDGVQQFAGFKMRHSGLGETDFVQSFETPILENAAPGLHILHIPIAAADGALSFEFLRSRRNTRPRQLTTSASIKRVLATGMTNTAAGPFTPVLFDDIPTPRRFRPLDIEFTEILAAGDGIIIHGGTHGANGAAQPFAGIIIGPAASNGRLTVSEATGPASWNSTELGSTNISGTQHTYRIVSKPDLTIDVYVDGSLVGTFNGVHPYWGGVAGVWKANAGGSATINALFERVSS